MHFAPTRRSIARHSLVLAALVGCAGLAGCAAEGEAEAGYAPDPSLHEQNQKLREENRRLGAEVEKSMRKTAPSSAPSTTQAATTASTQPATFPTEAERAVLTEITQLTGGFDRAGEGYFSADGKWVIFQATPKGEKHYQMYVAKLIPDEGWVNETPKSEPFDRPLVRRPAILGQPVRISPANTRNTCGYFSPDGGAIIFGSTAGKEVPEEPGSGYQRQGGNYRWDFPDGMEIYRAADWQKRVDEALAGLRGVTDKLARGYAGHIHESYVSVDLATPTSRLTDNNAYDAEGTYSADGKWIVLTSRRTGDAELWVMRADGSNPVQLTHAKGYDGGPFFSPDGKRLVYRSDRKGNDLLQIFVADVVYDAAGNITGVANENQLTNADVNWGPSWHPDGQHIIFATSKHGHHNYELYAIRADGSHPTRITYSPGFDGLPVFSPDGTHLMWSAKRSADNTTQLFLAKFKAPADW